MLATNGDNKFLIFLFLTYTTISRNSAGKIYYDCGTDLETVESPYWITGKASVGVWDSILQDILIIPSDLLFLIETIFIKVP